MRPKLTNCTPDDLIAMFRRLGGFSIKEGGKHTRITHILSGKATIIARHSRVDPHIARSIINHYLIADLGYDREKIYKNLKS